MIWISFFFILATGYLTVLALLPSATLGEKTSLAFPFGMGLTTFGLFLSILFKLPVSPGTLLGLQGSLFAGILFLLYRRGQVFLLPQFPPLVRSKPSLAHICIVLLFLSSLIFNLFFPILVNDGITYDFLGKILFMRQTFLLPEDDFHAFDNRTLGFHLISSYFYLFDFHYPKLVQSFFYMSLIAFFYTAIKRFIPARQSGAFTLLLATAPLVYWHSILYLNNLSAALYFFAGIVFWFYSIHYRQPGFLLISSFSFSLAAWTRFETIAYFFFPLLLTYYDAIERRQEKIPYRFLLFPLIFSGFWFAFNLVYFYSSTPMGRTYGYMALFFGLAVSVPVYRLVYHEKINFQSAIKIGLSCAAIFAVAALTNEHFRKTFLLFLSILKTKLLTYTLEQCAWGWGISLALFIPFYYSSLSSSQKLLLLNLVFLWFAVPFLMMQISLSARMQDMTALGLIKTFFLSIGSYLNTSSSRQFFFFFPSLLFLIGISFHDSESSSGIRRRINSALFKHPVFNGLCLLVLGNAITIGFFIIGPRISYLKNHFGESHVQILQSPGPRDAKNVYYPTYKIAFAISRLTPENSTIIFPDPRAGVPFEKEPYNKFGIYQSYSVLFPRKLLWDRQDGRLPDTRGAPDVYRVTNGTRSNNDCKLHPEGKTLGYMDWMICPAAPSGD